MFFEDILDSLSCVSIYGNVLEDKMVSKFVKLLRKLSEKDSNFMKLSELYADVCHMLYESEYFGNLPGYIFSKILYDENVFTVRAANERLSAIPAIIRQAATNDLHALLRLCSVMSVEVKATFKEVFPKKEMVISMFPDFISEKHTFTQINPYNANLSELAEFHYRNGISIFAKYYAFTFSDKQKVVPVKNFAPVNLTSLKKYELQKQQITDNTMSFIHRKPANNVLLYGDRGTGKSTMVNAILNEYHENGLRMIQIAKEDIVHIHKLLKAIRNVPLRFVIFIDDLTFNENDEGFNTLKAVLEGSLSAMPSNVLIYATTNRRHLIKETFSAREGNELHASDTRDENASLADRFGLTITFSKPNLPDFLEIVCEIAKERELDIDEEVLRRGANTFAMRKASRSGRVARQYVDYVEGRLSLNLPL